MPSYSDKGVWYHEVVEHFIKGKNRSFVCTQNTANRCPICEHGAGLAASGQEDAAKDFKASTRFLINVLVLSDPNGKVSIKDGVKVMKIPATVKTALLDMDTDFGGGYGDIINFHTGMNVNIDRAGMSLTTKYTAKAVPIRSSIVDTIQQEGLNIENFTLHLLDQFAPAKSYEDLVADFGALMSDAPAQQAAPVAQATIKPAGPTLVQGVVPAGVPTVQGFTVGAPKVNVLLTQPVLPPKV
jgi:hypothetical protein